jgi:hypothetical protein
LIVGARELTHRIVLCKTFIYIYVQLFGPYDRTRDVGSSEISVIHPRRGGSRSERRGVALRPDKIQQCNTISSKENFKNVLKIIITK